MTPDAFGRMLPEEFEAVYKAWDEKRESERRDEWERMRMQTFLMLTPHMSKGKRFTPEKLLTLPWDNKKEPAKPTPKSTAERMKELAGKLTNAKC